MVRYRKKANRDRIEKSRQRDRRRKWGKAGVTRKQAKKKTGEGKGGRGGRQGKGRWTGE